MNVSFAWWNIHRSTASKKEDCVRYLSEKGVPDVFCLLEISSKDAIRPLRRHFPDHRFVCVDDQIIIAVRASIFSFVTTRNEFKSSKSTLRPGVLVTINKEGIYMSLLFLHLKAFDSPLDYGLRDDMYQHLSSLRRKLPGDYPLVFAGDLNNVGLNATYNSKSDLTPDEELSVLDKRMKSVKMHRHDNKMPTWWNGGTTYPPTAIDHFYHSPSIEVEESFVFGWPYEQNQKQFIKDYSDHGLIFSHLKIIT